MKTGAAQLCSYLVSRGVSHVFGVPGSQNIALYDALRQSSIHSVLTTNELAAGFMAIGYYRASGRLAPLFTIPGPGFTWALTPIAEALQDSAALLHVVGRTPGTDHRRYLQAIDQRAVVAPLCKGTFRIDVAADIGPELEKAIALALSGEPGPVIVETLQSALESAAQSDERSAEQDRLDTSLADLDDVVTTLANAKRPIIFVGQGAIGGSQRVRELAEMIGAPVCSTASGRGVLPEDHPLALCFDGERGNVPEMNQLLEHSDLVLVLGCKLGFSGTIGFQLKLPSDRLVRVDRSEDILGVTCPARVSFVEDVGSFLDRLLPKLVKHAGHFECVWTRDEIERRANRLRKSAANIVEPFVQGVEHASVAHFFAALRRALPRDAVVCADSGLHQQMLRRHFDVLAPRGLLFPSDYQSMGFAIPAAIGAKLGAPERTVVAVLGDGGFAMSGLELLTAVREGISLTVIVLNDGYLGRIRLEQLAALGRTSGVALHNPDFQAFARSVGANYALIERDTDSLLRTCIGEAGVTLVEVRLADSVNTYVVRAKGLVRAATRKAFGPRMIKTLKKILPR
ncbi:MAG: thiamine pyrophosphate-binding protein [Hyphomicrobium sp.]|uniref:thiamine pyrophosphate-binding protein n=1 Tax=Hyphomicrobium sp. TaxID=82 RepID=UPI00356419B9